jgi:glycosyltransferase involved in cell wall biosynthesis
MGDVQRLAELMIYMADNKEKRREMGRYAANHVKKFSVDSTVSALMKALRFTSSR